MLLQKLDNDARKSTKQLSRSLEEETNYWREEDDQGARKRQDEKIKENEGRKTA